MKKFYASEKEKNDSLREIDSRISEKLGEIDEMNNKTRSSKLAMYISLAISLVFMIIYFISTIINSFNSSRQIEMIIGVIIISIFTVLFIYNSLNNDKDLAKDLLSYNKNMLIIDATNGMETTYGEEELWLNPSNLLMIAQNIKNGLNEYITNNYLKKQISNNYEKLKVSLSELDADIKLTAENATRKVIVVNNDSLKYLEKYGFTVISLDDSTNSISDKTVTDIKNKIKNGEINHLFILDKTTNSDIFNQIVNDTGINTLTFKRLDNITDTERDNKEDYMTLMNYNIELLKSELY